MSIDPKDQKKQTIDNITYKYSTDWIKHLESETHWRLYWQQQNIMENLLSHGDQLLEIGVGTGFTANYLRSKKMQVTTLDIDADKNPDIVANIVQYPFPIEYDHILAFEVFEHIPFAQFKTILPKLSNASRQYVFISVPCHERILGYGNLKLPKLPKLSFQITRPKKKITSPHHFWEVGEASISISTLKSTFRETGFKIHRQQKKFSRLFFALESPHKKPHLSL